MALAERYRDLLLKLLPKGKTWAPDTDGWLFKWAYASGDELARVDQAAKDLLREIDPRFTSELITDFEKELGLPDECALLVGGSIEQRRQDIISRLTGLGGQSEEYFTQVFDNAGVTITFSYIQPSRVGLARIGDRLYGPQYLNIFFVNIPAQTLTVFQTGLGQTGQPLSSYGDDHSVACFIDKNKPAHSYSVFTYS